MFVDDQDRPLQFGQRIIFASSSGRSDGTLNYGEIIKINKASVTVQPLNPDGSYKLRMVYMGRRVDNTPIWEETLERVAPKIANYTHKEKFHIL